MLIMTKDPDRGKQQKTTPSEGSMEPSPRAVGTAKWGPVTSLVVMPLLMVTAFVVVVVLFGWLGLAGEGVEQLVARLQRADRQAFRDAVTLVQMLRDPANDPLRRDEWLARELARLLREELSAGHLDAPRIQLRSFLCRALGELDREEVLDPLLVAAGTERDVREIEVRRSALEAIAQLLARRPDWISRTDERLLGTLLEATDGTGTESPGSGARDAQRATATFALGVVDDPRAHARLVTLLDDPCVDVRFNAATGLARWGRLESVPVLLEMLDPDAESVVAGEAVPRQRAWRRQIVLRSALRSVELLSGALLSGALSPPDRQRLHYAVRRLTRHPDDLTIQHVARRTLQALEASLPSECSVYDG
jgi:HEAT repeat protein